MTHCLPNGVDACDAARRALELAESRSRRNAVERLAGLLRDQDADPTVAEALRLALQLLEPMRNADGVATSAGGSPADDAPPADEPGSASSPEPEGPAEEPPLDVTAALLEAEGLLDARDVVRARDALLALAIRQRALGRLDAALDACLVLMTIDPSDTQLQLEIAANQEARGWSGLAAEKVRLLGRLADLDADADALAAVKAFAARHGIPTDTSAVVAGSGEDARGD